MTRIGGGGPPPPDKTDISQESKAEQPAKTQQQEGAKSARVPGQKQVADSFKRVAPQMTSRLTAMATQKSGTPSIVFTSEHMAELAEAFAGELRKNKKASPRDRARMFAKVVLKNRRFGKIFDDTDEEELQTLYDLIGDQLDDSPVLAQLMEEITAVTRNKLM